MGMPSFGGEASESDHSLNIKQDLNFSLELDKLYIMAVLLADRRTLIVAELNMAGFTE